MNRRLFLASLIGSASAAIIDPDRLLWVPGRKLISIPKPLVIPANLLNVGDVITISGRFIFNPITREMTAVLQPFRISHKAQSQIETSWILEPLLDLRPAV